MSKIQNLSIIFYKKKLPIKSFGDIFDKFSDWIIRFITRGPYSHCEIAYPMNDGSGNWKCFSSSGRDGGVRIKEMHIDDDSWDIVPIGNFIGVEDCFSETELLNFHSQYIGKKYDWKGAIGIGLGIKENENKLFCSEYCAMFLGYPDSWRYSPNQLFALSKIKENN